MIARNLKIMGWLVWLATAIAGLPAIADGQEFRVDTELFRNQEKDPFLQTLTIFADGAVYDFQLTEPAEATVFDARRGQFTLLDESRRARATVTTQELLDFSLALETHAAQQRDRLLAFCAAPNFEISENPVEQNGQALTELKLSAKPLVYVVRAQKSPRPEAVKIYRHFADWCARLNATRPNLPPGARLALNQALAERDLLPLEITRTTFEPGALGEKKMEIRSQHRLNWSLSGEDRKKIERAGDMLATFQAVSYDEYRKPQQKTATAKQARR